MKTSTPRIRERGASISVLIPTYRRAEPLRNCVASILAGSRVPDEILMVGREGDLESEHIFTILRQESQSRVLLRTAWTTKPGHVPPVEVGVGAASGELIAIVDDDVAVTSDWLASLVPHFHDPKVGVVGGRVLVVDAPPVKPRGKPGCMSWYGKLWGNLGSLDRTVAVDSVMEGNCIWRRELLASLEFDPVLNFDDASMYGLDLCLQAKKRGFTIKYDPLALVYHYPAPRADGLDRQERGPRVFSYCRNYTYIMLKRLPFWRRLVFLAWWFLIGERDAWGLGSLAIDELSGNGRKNRHISQALRGKVEGARLSFRG